MLAHRFVRWLVASTDRALDFLDVGDLSLELDHREKQRIVVASILPFVLLSATLYQLGFEIDQGDRYGLPGGGSEIWYRLSIAACILLSVLPFLCAAILFFHGVAPVSRGLGTWCLAAALSIFGAACLLTAYVGAVEVLVSPLNFFTRADLHYDLAFEAATNCGIVALGYAYLAYRGLAIETEAEAALG